MNKIIKNITFQKIRKIIEIVLIFILIIGVLILIKEYRHLSQLALSLDSGDINLIHNYWYNKTGQVCSCFFTN